MQVRQPHSVKHPLYRREQGGHAIVTMVGVMMVTMMASVLAIDLPTYYVAQNQLQTAANAAAIAGAYKLPEGFQQAEDAAYDVAAQNPVAGVVLQPGNLQFVYGSEDGADMTMAVNAQSLVPTIMGKMLCSMTGGTPSGGWDAAGDGGGEGSGLWDEAGAAASPCNAMRVSASAKAVPAARDTILVIDTSSSMVDGVQPIIAVKAAAKKFVDMVDALNNASIDKISVVDFNRFGFEKIGLTADKDHSGTGFQKVKDAITNLKTYGSSTPGYVGGWNTNYYIGLKTALDEIETNGRKNAKKSIVFLTDGKPNLPAPASYGSNYGAAEYRMCADPVNNNTTVKNLKGWLTVSGQKRYYTGFQLPYYACYQVDKNNNGKIDSNETSKTCTDNMTYAQHLIKNSHVETIAVSKLAGKMADKCGKDYIDYMTSMVQGQIDRAKTLGVTIHTIEIYDPNEDGTSTDYLKRISAQLDWDPQLVELIAEQTEGQTYSTVTSDTSGITAIYEEIAKDVRVKLAH